MTKAAIVSQNAIASNASTSHPFRVAIIQTSTVRISTSTPKIDQSGVES